MSHADKLTIPIGISTEIVLLYEPLRWFIFNTTLNPGYEEARRLNRLKIHDQNGLLLRSCKQLEALLAKVFIKFL